jgi:hypothetical protein
VIFDPQVLANPEATSLRSPERMRSSNGWQKKVSIYPATMIGTKNGGTCVVRVVHSSRVTPAALAKSAIVVVLDNYFGGVGRQIDSFAQHVHDP